METTLNVILYVGKIFRSFPLFSSIFLGYFLRTHKYLHLHADLCEAGKRTNKKADGNSSRYLGVFNKKAFKRNTSLFH